MMGCVHVSEQRKRTLYDVIRKAPPELRAEVFKTGTTDLTMTYRWPHNAVLELLPMCNLACKMCYVRKTPAEAEVLGGIIGGAEWCRIVDACSELGVLNFTITGGECMLHPAFFDIYNHIYEQTPYVTLMSNAGLITQEHIELFKRRTPYKIVITVYGASRETYGRLCANEAAYDRVMASLRLLKDNQIPFYIQMTVVRENVHDLQKVKQLAEEYGVRFECMDSLVCYGNTTEMVRENERTEPELVRQLRGVDMNAYMSMSEKEARVIATMRVAGKPPRPGIRCNAGRNTLVINWRGFMQPCTVLDAYQANVRGNDLRKCWTDMVKWADEQIVVPECYGCLFATKCVTCIAQHYNDTHDFSKPSPRLCWKRLHPEEAAAMEAEFEEKVKAAEAKLRAEMPSTQE